MHQFSASSSQLTEILGMFSKTVESPLDNFMRQGSNKGMSSNPESTSAKGKDRDTRAKPVWAEGLRRMYDEVVDEKLPDDFLDLLKQLDKPSDHS